MNACPPFPSRWIALGFAATVALSCARASVYTLNLSDTTGSQTFVNKNVGYLWDFYFTDSPLFNTVTTTFSIKTGASTSDPLVVTLYRLDTNATVGSASLAAASGPGTFTNTNFSLINNVNYPSGYSFVANVVYRLSLTSTADTPGNVSWLIENPADGLQATNSYSPSTIVFSSTAASFNPTTTTATSASPSVSPNSVSSVPDFSRSLPLVLIGAGAAFALGRGRGASRK